jgi:hypothetical protein
MRSQKNYRSLRRKTSLRSLRRKNNKNKRKHIGGSHYYQNPKNSKLTRKKVQKQQNKRRIRTQKSKHRQFGGRDRLEELDIEKSTIPKDIKDIKEINELVDKLKGVDGIQNVKYIQKGEKKVKCQDDNTYNFDKVREKSYRITLPHGKICVRPPNGVSKNYKKYLEANIQKFLNDYKGLSNRKEAEDKKRKIFGRNFLDNNNNNNNNSSSTTATQQPSQPSKQSTGQESTGQEPAYMAVDGRTQQLPQAGMYKVMEGAETNSIPGPTIIKRQEPAVEESTGQEPAYVLLDGITQQPPQAGMYTVMEGAETNTIPGPTIINNPNNFEPPDNEDDDGDEFSF